MTASSFLSGSICGADTVVLDTNVVLDWMVFGDTSVSALASAVEAGQLQWLLAPGMRDELADVLARPLWARWHANPPTLLSLVDRHARVCDSPAASGLICADADDQVFIDLAIAQRAHWLLTRDKALLKLARQAALRGTVVCRPDAWPDVTAGRDAAAPNRQLGGPLSDKRFAHEKGGRSRP